VPFWRRKLHKVTLNGRRFAKKISILVLRVLKVGFDLKKFMELMSHYKTVNKLKNLRIMQEDVDLQKKNLNMLTGIKCLLELISELDDSGSYFSQLKMVFRLTTIK